MAMWPVKVVLLVLFFIISVSQEYYVEKRLNCSNVQDAIKPNQDTDYVKFLGVFNTTQQCIDSCLNHSTKNNLCQSYTFCSPYLANIYKSQCFGRFGLKYGILWTPVYRPDVNCGRIIYHCSSDLDCQLNGKCDNTGNCTCTDGWSGPHCQTLNLLPVTNGTGYHIINDNNSGKPTSSWGGAVLVDKNDKNEKTKYHMILAEFDNHCGVNSWTINSVVTHAQSTNGYNSPFKRVEVLHQHFAHEPDAINGPNGEIVLYYSAYNYSNNIAECVCSDGSTPPSCTPPAAEFINIMQYSMSGSFNGPWQRDVIFPTKSVNSSDTNLAGVINKNGSFIGFSRIFSVDPNNGPIGSQIYLVTSDNWKIGEHYIMHTDKGLVFPNLSPFLTEDPFLYIDCNENYHAIFHNMSPGDDQTDCGGHAFSQNGIDWIYGGASFGNTIQFTDKSQFTFSRRERPHFIFDDDECTPVALTSGVQYGGEFGDATYTLLQPIRH